MAKTDKRTRLEVTNDLDMAVISILDYIYPKDGQVPPLGNLTPMALVDQIGFLKELQKDAEKTENILWQRLSSLQGGGHPTNSKGVPTPNACEGDKFAYVNRNNPRTAINQEAVKTYMESKHVCQACGVEYKVPNFFSTTDVFTKTVSRK